MEMGGTKITISQAICHLRIIERSELMYNTSHKSGIWHSQSDSNTSRNSCCTLSIACSH